MLKRKKGSIQDILYVGMVILFLGFLLLIGFTIMSNVNDQVQSNSAIDALGKTASSDLTSDYTGIMDNMMLVLIVGLGIGAIVLASLVRVHPIFLVLFIIMLIVIIFFSAIFSNIYQTAAENPALTAYADQLTFTSLILEFLPFIVGIFGFIVMIVLYKVGQGE